MTRNWRIVLLICLGTAVAACSSPADAPTGPNPVLGQPVTVTLTPLGDPEVPLFNVAGAETSGRGPCTFDPSSGQFVCPPQNRDGLTFTIRYTLYDANGKVLSEADRAKVASIKTETTASGTTVRDGATVTIDRSGTMVSSGLGPDAKTHTLNGTERGTVSTSMTRDGRSVSTKATMDATTTNLVVPVRRGEGDRGYPLSGTRLHSSVTTTTMGSESRTMTMRRVETFNGTSTVQVEMTVNGVTQTCSFDLEARTTTCKR